MRVLIVLMACLAFPVAKADEIRLPGDLKTGDASSAGVLHMARDAATVTFSSESGVARVPIVELPGELRKLLGCDVLDVARGMGAEKDTVVAGTMPAIIHGTLLENTEKGLLVAVAQDSGRTALVQTSNGNTISSVVATRRSTTEKTSGDSHSVQTEEPIYETVLYLIRGNQNAERLKSGMQVNYRVIPTGADFYKGAEAVAATFVQSLE
ncbi:MAG: hypothetical protein ACREKL_00190 [Chthoniobacterales bacterium]